MNGEVKKSYALNLGAHNTSSGASAFSKLIGSSFYFSVLALGGPEQSYSIAELNIVNGDIKLHTPYGEPYKKGCWGAMNFDYNYQTYNPDTKCIIISHPADHNIHVFDTKTRTTKVVYGGSKAAGSIEAPYKSMAELATIPPEVYSLAFLRSASYQDITYDVVKKRYYRNLNLPITQPNKDVISALEVRQSIVIEMDENFKILGEYGYIPKKYTFCYGFNWPGKGFYLSKNNTENEDFRIFCPLVQ